MNLAEELLEIALSKRFASENVIMDTWVPSLKKRAEGGDTFFTLSRTNREGISLSVARRYFNPLGFTVTEDSEDLYLTISWDKPTKTEEKKEQ